MKNILSVIVVALVLVAVVTGCGGMHRYDARLAAADSLMHDVPDSALALVQAVDPASLTREGDRAYRDLLLTQARYRCYITATSDSDINRALAYYRRHDGEREKLTRAYIYKGAVMEELGYPDSAMLYYKHAEATAAPDDYFNLGYVNMRMGSLYTDYYAFDGMGINKFESALQNFKQTGNLYYQHKCLNNLGCLYREKQPQKSEALLNEALETAFQLNDTNGIIADAHSLIVLYSYIKQYGKAQQWVQYVYHLGKPLGFSYYTTAADVFSALGMPDSALQYLRQAEESGINNDEERMYYIKSLSLIALAQNDTINYMRLQAQKNQISDTLLANSHKLKISKIENDCIIKEDKKKLRNSLQLKLLIFIILTTAILLLAVMGLLYLRKLMTYRLLISELKNESDSQLKTLNQLQQNIGKLKIVDEPIKEFISTQLSLLRDITVACYHEPQNKLSNQLKDILQFNESNRQNWVGLYDYIDVEYSNIMTITRENYPHLNDKDMLLLALSCLGFSYVQIAIMMGYSNHTSIGTLKHRLAEKMNLEGSLSDYINGFALS